MELATAAAPAPEPAAPGDGSPKTAAPADVAKLVDSEVKKREEQLRSELEAELAKKKAEINAAKTAEPAPKPTTSPKPATKPAPAKVAESKGPEKAAPDSAGATAGSAPASAATPPTPESASAGVTPTVAPSQPAPATKTAAALPVAEPSAPAVRAGDLVEMGPGVTPPVLVSVNKPEYPPIARRMRVEGTVVLSLLVDENGRVLDVRLEHGVRENVGINEAAIAAAKSARFRPATKDGVRVKVWHQLTIPFKL